MTRATRRFGAARLVGLVLAVTSALTAACAGGQGDPAGTSTTDPAITAGPADWTTFGHDAARSGAPPDVAPPGPMAVGWNAQLDGAVYGQPLVLGGLVVAATENDTVYGLDAASGQVRWQAHVGTPVPKSALPCGDIDPLGITSTPVYDPASGEIFALAETTGGEHVLAGVRATDGTVVSRRTVDPPQGDRLSTQQRGALVLLDGQVEIVYGGLAGDCANYIGAVVSAPTTGSGPVTSYTIPTSREGGIWAPGGPIVVGDHLLVSVGNGDATSAPYDGSDATLALSPGGLTRTDFFAPSSWADDNQNDLDLGSMTPAAVGPYVVADGKRGEAYVMRADHLGGIGGQVATAQVCTAFGAAAVAGDTAYIPCPDGTRAVRIGPDGAASVLWHAPVPADGSPVVAAGAVFTIDSKAGVLYALDETTGAVLQQITVGPPPHFAMVSVAGTRAYVSTLTGVTAVSGV